jgi:antitoxin component of MazEF toxin-antitoxin module
MSQGILKWGNSLAFRIPSAIARQMGLEEGAQVEFSIDGKRLIIEKADEVSAFTRENLVKALRMAKRDLIDLGGPQGKEIL